jgi:organic hydroperoxide reductase OsmC/OhrA
MSDLKATIHWKLSGQDFLKGRYSREHTWSFDGGVVVPASSSPSIVPVPMSNPAHVDPEEAFVAAVSSCHMLSFLYVACKAQFQVESYDDDAVGMMAKNEKGVPWVSAITLHPRITWGGAKKPSATELAALHHQAHEQCFIAASIKTQVSVSQ